ncbi:hypothetical protein Bca52824_094440 [Brassica carinata]|uniref:Uncharacterized protein n=1 Tax=Brassica carinata TaxID=52824 RepID=A0A8X7P3L3_BRACI|nr:hypothetical protein Bca52824_094440 [Brassica carinata]
MISSHCIAVVSLCAMKTQVLLLASDLSVFIISASVLLSNALVASSHSRILGDFRKARASATLCFSPPLSISPLSPTAVLYFSGKFMIVS